MNPELTQRKDESEKVASCKNVDFTDSLRIENLSEVATQNIKGLKGELINSGECNFDGVSIEIEFFDKKGEFLFDDSIYIKKIKARTHENFFSEVNYANTCENGCSKSEKKDYSSFKAKISSASPEYTWE